MPLKIARRDFMKSLSAVIAATAAIPEANANMIFGALTPSAQWFVDSVGGSDSNNGTSAATPYQTIGKLLTQSITSGQLIALKCGSHFREQLDILRQSIFSGWSDSAAGPSQSSMARI